MSGTELLPDGEPVRLLSEGSGADALVRRALDEARADLPAPDDVERMLARFPFPPPNGGPPGTDGGDANGDGGGGGGNGGAVDPGAGGAVGAKALGATGAKIAMVVTVAVVATGAYVAFLRPPDAPAPAPSAIVSIPITVVTSETSASASSAPTVEQVLKAEPSASATARSAPTVGHRVSPAASVSSSDAPPRPEHEILREAQANKRSNPSRALALVNEHATSYPKSPMGQEREMIRIEALIANGQRAQAKALADTFKARHPTSAYAQRLDALLK